MKDLYQAFMAAALCVASLSSCDKLFSERKTTSGDIQCVDLGLSVKWANCNVGAKTEADFGDYFAWGETTSKTNYNWVEPGQYKHGQYNGSAAPDYGMTKYNSVDGLTTLQAGDDAATAALGNKWRMPTIDEVKELVEKCEWTWTAMKDSDGNLVRGYTVTSKVKGYEGSSIFLPAGGTYLAEELFDAGVAGHYWASTIESPETGCNLNFNKDEFYPGGKLRVCGFTVRAVTK